jgi:sortase A
MWKRRDSVNQNVEVIRAEPETPSRAWVVWLWIEKFAFTVGLSLLAIYGALRLESYLSSRAALKSFENLESTPAATEGLVAGTSSTEEMSLPEVDFDGWGESRVRGYKESLSKQTSAPMAVLQIPKLHLAVPLLDGTDALTLNHAVGRIAGTARPGEAGNIGIAGHRDGFFRGLKDIKVGDPVELKTVKGTETYVVDEIQIVKPDNVSVLRPRPVPSLTLVTCYPFYFIGSAPKRFVVTASLTQRQPAGSTTTETRPPTETSSSTKEEQ